MIIIIIINYLTSKCSKNTIFTKFKFVWAIFTLESSTRERVEIQRRTSSSNLLWNVASRCLFVRGCACASRDSVTPITFAYAIVNVSSRACESSSRSRESLEASVHSIRKHRASSPNRYVVNTSLNFFIVEVLLLKLIENKPSAAMRALLIKTSLTELSTDCSCQLSLSRSALYFKPLKKGNCHYKIKNYVFF